MSETKIVQPVGEGISTRSTRRTWIKPLLRVLLSGTVSVSAYLLVFLNEETVTRYFSRGGGYAAAVVATAIAFSLIHGTFANYLLELVGIRAKQGKNSH